MLPSVTWQRPVASQVSSLSSGLQVRYSYAAQGSERLLALTQFCQGDPRRIDASSAYLLRGCRTRTDSALVATWPHKLFASKVRPSRSALRAELARRLALYMPL